MFGQLLGQTLARWGGLQKQKQESQVEVLPLAPIRTLRPSGRSKSDTLWFRHRPAGPERGSEKALGEPQGRVRRSRPNEDTGGGLKAGPCKVAWA